jgi:hypothetical protein
MTSVLGITQQTLHPMMSKPEIELFKRYIGSARHYLEFGSGGSTYLASLNPLIEYIASVEGLESWINKCSKLKQIKRLMASNKLAFHYIDYNAGDDCGKPINNEKSQMFNVYSDIVTKYAPRTFDTIFIDGRFRVACALKAYDFIDSKARIMFHDYMSRPEYKVIEEFFTVVDSVDSMAVLQKRADINRDNLEEYIDYYKDIAD